MNPNTLKPVLDTLPSMEEINYVERTMYNMKRLLGIEYAKEFEKFLTENIRYQWLDYTNVIGQCYEVSCVAFYRYVKAFRIVTLVDNIHKLRRDFNDRKKVLPHYPIEIEGWNRIARPIVDEALEIYNKNVNNNNFKPYCPLAWIGPVDCSMGSITYCGGFAMKLD